MKEHLLQFFVPGIPRPGGSKRAFAIRKKDGSIGVRVADMGGNLTMTWRSTVADFARQAMQSHEPFTQAIVLEVLFRMPRPKAHFSHRTGEVSFRYELCLCTKRPDATKLLRAVEDALSGIVWHDDAQIVKQYVWKFYDVNPGAFITVSNADVFEVLQKRKEHVYREVQRKLTQDP